MKINDQSTYWLSNKSWYRINTEKGCFEICDSAPEKAKISFRIWCGEEMEENDDKNKSNK